MRIMRKGISPLIAAVILLGLTMGVAAIFAQWTPELVDDLQTDSEDQSEDLLEHNDVALELEDVDANDVRVSQTSGSVPAGDIVVTWYGEDDEYQNTTESIEEIRGSIVVEATDDQVEDLIEVEADPSVDLEGAHSVTSEPDQ